MPSSLENMVDILRAAGEPTRMRLLALLAESDLTVSDLIEILGQSQPRISRHLKLLAEAGLLERYQEGAWAYYRAVNGGVGGGVVEQILTYIDPQDPVIMRDMQRLEAVRTKRASVAQKYFAANAENWDQLRRLHADEAKVEAAILGLVEDQQFHTMLDIGTGTGRMLELFKDYADSAVGVDSNRDMLAIARETVRQSNLENVQVRQGNVTMLQLANDQFDLITIHQVLHYFDDPKPVLEEAARCLAPGGKLLIVDFAPHHRDELRTLHAHVRLGFSDEQMREWMQALSLDIVQTRYVQMDCPQGQSEELLTVSIWLAQDQRQLIASAAASDQTNQNNQNTLKIGTMV